ncbi:unnamed protein product [Triticum turgidum subsp. durum]|uniref:Brix domain-containing protein n=1 Tax=Triticum turgidum subsp. durum TaxID=4567 RepID=A0A9R1A370_TRITD|nr:unnamed protein product [Triticum turgidum subsp. durum]
MALLDMHPWLLLPLELPKLLINRGSIASRQALVKVRRNFTGERTANIMKHLFPVPKPESKRLITFANRDDYISFRHHIYEKHGGPKSIDLKEVGPRFELRLYQIKRGTMDQSEAQNEFVLRPYMNTAKKQKSLGV